MERKMYNQQVIKSIISGKDLHPGELEYVWQETVLERIENFDQMIGNSIEEILKPIGNIDIEDEIRDSVQNREGDIIYLNYNRGLFDGIKLALLLKAM